MKKLKTKYSEAKAAEGRGDWLPMAQLCAELCTLMHKSPAAYGEFSVDDVSEIPELKTVFNQICDERIQGLQEEINRYKKLKL